MCGYANNHSRDTYRLLNTKTKSITQTRNVKWSNWKPTQPGDDIQIESLKADDKDDEGEDDYEINHAKYFGRGEDDDNDSSWGSIPELQIRNDDDNSSSGDEWSSDEEWESDDDDESIIYVEVPDVVSGRIVTVDWSDSEDEEEEEEEQQQPPQPNQQNQNQNPIQTATTPAQ